MGAQYDAAIRRGTAGSVTAQRERKLPSADFQLGKGLIRQHPSRLTISTLAVVGSAVCKETPDATPETTAKLLEVYCEELQSSLSPAFQL
jgi:hypothetical protein